MRVEIGEKAALQQWIIREIDAWHDMRRTVGNLFGFSEEIVRPAIKNHASDYLQGHQFFGNQLGRVQMIERKSVSFLLREKLQREFPLREISRCDGLEHIAAGPVLTSTGNLDGLIPNRGLQAEFRTPVEFDDVGFAPVGNQPETMHT